MANALFDKGRQNILEGAIAILTVNVKLVLVDHGVDAPVVATDDFLDDILAGARIATSAAFGSKTTTDGVFDAADVTLVAVTGASVESIVIYNDTPATEAGKHLIAYIDVATGLPFTPSGGEVTIQWDAGANRIFKL